MCFPICTAVILDECGGEPAQHIPLSLFWAKAGILFSGLGSCCYFCWTFPLSGLFSCKTIEAKKAAWHYPAVHRCIWRGSGRSLWLWEEKATTLVWGQVGQEDEPLSQDVGSVLGLQELEAGNFPAALSLLQEAAGGFCSKKILAQIYTCLGCCAQRMVMTAQRGRAA